MKKSILVLFAFLITKMVLQFYLINPIYDLHRDEFLHLDQAKHLAWGFTSVPPVSSWIGWIILQLGNGVFWVKFFPALFGALTLLLVWKTIEALKGGPFALLMGAIAILFSALLRINILFQPNSLEILLWTMVFFATLKYIQASSQHQQESPQWLYILAICFALGFLNKYNIVFLLLGLIPALLMTEHRKIFSSKHFYFSVLLALLLISPNLLWQYQNGFPVIGHMKELQRTQLVNVHRMDFVKEQFLFFFGSIFVLIAAFISFLVYPPFKKYRIFFWSFCFSIALFIYFKAKDYYAIGLYPILIAFGAVYLESLLSKPWWRYLKPICLLIPIILLVPIFKVIFPLEQPDQIQKNIRVFKNLGMLHWEDGKEHNMPQDFADMLGWRELACKVDSAFLLLNDSKHTLVYCDNYGQAGAINYYSKIKGIHAVSYNADYLNWFPLNDTIKQVIQIKEAKDVAREAEEQRSQFESVERFGEITAMYAREKGTTILILKNAKINLMELVKKEIAEEKQKH
jgi:hypothetical protein